RDERGKLTPAEREQAAAGGRSAAERRRRAGAAAEQRRAAEQLREQRARTERRREGAEAPGGRLQLATVRPAGVGVGQVTADEAVEADATLMRCGELHADLLARGAARLRGGRQRHARARERRLDARDRDRQRGGDLVVAHAAQLPHQQRGTLLLGQAA